MTRVELLKIVVGQARANGFEFRRWYTAQLGLSWISSGAAFTLLEAQRRYYALLFSHEFACAFWKPGSEITFQVAQQTFQRVMPNGSVATVTRKPFTRRSARADVWRYHLREMAAADDPLRYIRKYLRVDEELEEAAPEVADATGLAIARNARKPGRHPAKTAKGAVDVRRPAKRAAKPLPKDLPAFLRRPYP